MRHLFLSTALATAALIGLPAALHAAGTGEQSASAQSSATGAETQSMAMSQDTLRRNLEAAGFTNIEIVDAAYLVRAQTQDGDQVLMFLDPPRQTAAAQTQTGQQAGEQQAPAEQLAESYRSFEQAGMDTGQTISGDLTGDDLLGNEVVDQAGETIGTVSDLLVDQTDEVRAAVIEMDGEHVAVAIENLQIEEGAGGQLALDMSRGDLQQQPTYEREGGDWNLTHE